MADAYVTRDQFDEFVKRIEQALGYAEKARAQGLAIVNQRFELVEKRFEQVEKHFEQVNERFAQIDQRFAQVDQRFTQLDQRLDEFRAEVRADVQSFRNWMIGLYSPLVLALVAAVVKWIFFPSAP